MLSLRCISTCLPGSAAIQYSLRFFCCLPLASRCALCLALLFVMTASRCIASSLDACLRLRSTLRTAASSSCERCTTLLYVLLSFVWRNFYRDCKELIRMSGHPAMRAIDPTVAALHPVQRLFQGGRTGQKKAVDVSGVAQAVALCQHPGVVRAALRPSLTGAGRVRPGPQRKPCCVGNRGLSNGVRTFNRATTSKRETRCTTVVGYGRRRLIY